MDSSCIDESTTSSDSTPPLLVEKLCRVGSGTSTVIDSSDFGPGIEAESTRKLPSSKYKGVVPQPNGRWGAQIYEKHQRVWLGTFNQEIQAAVAYDTAVQRFRGRDAVTNFKPLSEAEAVEISFLNSHSKAEIVDMLRKHTYNDELEQSRRSRSLFGANNNQNCPGYNNMGSGGGEREQMFEKVVTPSDVGKLNRLVIPKQQAEKHFVLKKEAVTKGVLLNFEDESGKVWRFRYSYWNSSQSYVLTKGWSRFVKEKGLQAGDVVSFKRSGGPGQDHQHQQQHQQLYIEWKLKGREKNSSVNNNKNDGNVVNGGGGASCNGNSTTTSGIRLFGVNIYEVQGKKRSLEVDYDDNEDSKKQKVIINVL